MKKLSLECEVQKIVICLKFNVSVILEDILDIFSSFPIHFLKQSHTSDVSSLLFSVF